MYALIDKPSFYFYCLFLLLKSIEIQKPKEFKCFKHVFVIILYLFVCKLALGLRITKLNNI